MLLRAGTGKTLALLTSTLTWLQEENRKDTKKISELSDCGSSSASTSTIDQPTENITGLCTPSRSVLSPSISADGVYASRLFSSGLNTSVSALSSPLFSRSSPMFPASASKDGTLPCSADGEVKGAKAVKPKRRKIFFCSRTHSQLQQVTSPTLILHVLMILR
jgi:hypothetical protein